MDSAKNPQLTENVFAQALELRVLEHILVQFRCPDKEKYSESVSSWCLLNE